jgi:hypothetical protein
MQPTPFRSTFSQRTLGKVDFLFFVPVTSVRLTINCLREVKPILFLFLTIGWESMAFFEIL